jgi:hypothetical protein
LVFYVLGLDSCVVTSELVFLVWMAHFLVWMWCAILGIFMLCVVSVVTTMVIGANIRIHNKVNPHVCNICPNQLLNSFFKVRGV